MGNLSVLAQPSLRDLAQVAKNEVDVFVPVQGFSNESGFETGSLMQQEQLYLTPYLPSGLTAPINGTVLKIFDSAVVMTYKHYKGGLNDIVSAVSGGMAANLFPEVSGAAIGAAVGSISGAAQAYFIKPEPRYILTKAAIGAVLGGMAGHVTSTMQSNFQNTAPVISEESTNLQPQVP